MPDFSTECGLKNLNEEQWDHSANIRETCLNIFISFKTLLCPDIFLCPRYRPFSFDVAEEGECCYFKRKHVGKSLNNYFFYPASYHFSMFTILRRLNNIFYLVLVCSANNQSISLSSNSFLTQTMSLAAVFSEFMYTY